MASHWQGMTPNPLELSKPTVPCATLRPCNSGSWSRSGTTTTSSTLPATAWSQKKSKRSFMKTAIHHGLFALGDAAYGRPDGWFLARRVGVATWLP